MDKETSQEVEECAEEIRNVLAKHNVDMWADSCEGESWIVLRKESKTARFSHDRMIKIDYEKNFGYNLEDEF